MSGCRRRVEERLAVIRSTFGGRQAFEELPALLGDDEWQRLLGDDEWQRLLGDVRTEVEAAKVDGVVTLPGATWIVSAVRPG